MDSRADAGGRMHAGGERHRRANGESGAAFGVGIFAFAPLASAASRPLALPPDAPVVLTGKHSALGSVWLPNGHLLVPTPSETLEIDPEHVNLPWRVRPLLQKEPLLAIAGTGGGDRFLVLDANGVTLWDATTLAPVKTIASADWLGAGRTFADRFAALPMAISANGSRVAVLDAAADRNPDGTLTVYDAHSAAVVAMVAPADDQDLAPDHVTLDDAGKLAVEVAGDAVWVRDIASGKTLVHRDLPRASSRGLGGSTDVAEIRGKRILLSSVVGLEILDATSGRLIARTNDQRAMDPLSIGLSADGTRFLFGRYAWDAVHGGAIVRAPKALEPHLADRWAFSPRTSLRTDGHFSTMTQPEGLELDDAKNHVVFRFGESRLASPESARPLESFGGVLRARAAIPADDVVFAAVTTPRAKVPLKDDGKISQAQSATHLFALDRGKKTTAVVAWDANGNESFRHVVPDEGGAATIEHVDDAVAMVAHSGHLLRCDAAGCEETRPAFASTDSFRDPWIVGEIVGRTNGAFVNLRTGEERPYPAGCQPRTVALAAADASYVCQHDGGTWVFGQVNGSRTIPLPNERSDWITFAFSFGDALSHHLYFNLDRDDFGVEHAIEYAAGQDLAHDHVTHLYIVDHGGIEQHDDGTIEVFGDREAAAAALRCQGDAGWLPFASCAARWGGPGQSVNGEGR